MARSDRGTMLTLLNYVQKWEENRGPTALVVLSSLSDFLNGLVDYIIPNTVVMVPSRKLLRIFGNRNVHFLCYANVYAKLLFEFPNAKYLFHLRRKNYPSFPPSNYSKYSDPNMGITSLPHQFRNKYISYSQFTDCHLESNKDYATVWFQGDWRKSCPIAPKQTDDLCKALGIKKPYVVINLPYAGNYPYPTLRRISQPKRYDPVIDHLIRQGFTIVQHGRREQAKFASRPGLIDYYESDLASPKNDLLLFSSSTFAIMTSSGPEYFALFANRPVLTLNKLEGITNLPSHKSRFFPKAVFDRQKEAFLSWEEFLVSPAYFDLDQWNNQERFEHHELSSEQLLEATKEFLTLIKEDEWECLTSRQRSFREKLNPCNLEINFSRAQPCDTYLKYFSSKTMKLTDQPRYVGHSQ
ncbi:MAG: TIGR04372 family glycosyltransferase [Chlamydiae bacterium]|nr:TIGR04372 family glycosyltransferase [Chlamydiota bacterium]